MTAEETPNDVTPAPRQPDPGAEATAIETVWRNVWVRAVSYVAFAIILVLVLWHLRSGYAFALQVGVIGFLIAYILNPVVGWLMKLRMRRALAVGITYALLLLLVAFGSVIVSQVVVEMGKFVQLVPTAIEQVTHWSGQLQNWIATFSDRLPSFLSDRLGMPDETGAISIQVKEQIASFLQQLGESLKRLLESLVAGGPGLLLTGATAVISTTFQVFLIFLAGAYFLYDFPRFIANFRRFVPVRYRSLAADLGAKADLAVGGYLRGQLLITLILGVIIWAGLSIIGIPLATAIAFLAAVFNLVPYLGPILGVTPAVLLGFTVSPLAAVLAALVFLVANQLEAHLFGPLILSRKTNLHPVTVMLAIMAGIGLMGLLGALLAVPVVALVKVVMEDYVLSRPTFKEVAPVEVDVPVAPDGADE
ncbi:MAG: AI-2E family transporter [Truepera sp.]|jgi:predicted PurR-regulated permease PerM|nr:AI-2E family transporter [Truepera sp.]